MIIMQNQTTSRYPRKFKYYLQFNNRLINFSRVTHLDDPTLLVKEFFYHISP